MLALIMLASRRFPDAAEAPASPSMILALPKSTVERYRRFASTPFYRLYLPPPPRCSIGALSPTPLASRAEYRARHLRQAAATHAATAR